MSILTTMSSAIGRRMHPAESRWLCFAIHPPGGASTPQTCQKERIRVIATDVVSRMVAVGIDARERELPRPQPEPIAVFRDVFLFETQIYSFLHATATFEGVTDRQSGWVYIRSSQTTNSVTWCMEEWLPLAASFIFRSQLRSLYPHHWCSGTC